jgi:SAM-dependent methyltransferase
MKLADSKSQAGQDIFVATVCPNGKTFLDVGCGAPITINNTYALEQIGWRGLLVDNSQEAIDACGIRASPAIRADATSLDWNAALRKYVPSWGLYGIDYLSLDIDEATFAAVDALMDEGACFRVITVEHDAYRHGDLLRAPIRNRFSKHDYILIAADVCSDDGLPYEDWWVYMDLADQADRFRSHNMRWRDILAQGGVII